MHREPQAHRRLAENEVIFRQHNRSIKEGLESIRAMAQEEGQQLLITESDTPLHFYCECSNEKCTKRIIIPPSEYNALHKVNNQFIVVPGHEVADIERVVESHGPYNVIQKYFEPPQQADRLNPSGVENR
jgi:hypothetical protein